MARQVTEIKEKEIVAAIRSSAHSLRNDTDLQPLYKKIGNASVVMLGEASHGTHEYYTWRSHISKYLIEKMGFNFIAVEGDWPDCYRLNRFIKGFAPGNETAKDVLSAFDRWPSWMWANWEIMALAEWMKEYNRTLSADRRAGFYGLDVYSLWESMESIMKYLEKTDKSALKLAEQAYRCFEPYRKDEGTAYARATAFVPELCQDEVVQLLKEIQHKLPTYDTGYENVFSVEQNALIAVNAEKYYRAMLHGGPHSWNVRDDHMHETLNRLMQLHGKDAKAIVWAHNTHIGDARATDMTEDGMFNIGELARSSWHNGEVALVGFGSYKGTVMAGRSWGAPMQVMQMPAAKKGSWEYFNHEAGTENKLLLMEDFEDNELFMENRIGHRAVGVVYNPAHEQFGNYVPTVLPRRYDAFIYLDETKALHPLHNKPDASQAPETWPFGV